MPAPSVSVDRQRFPLPPEQEKLMDKFAQFGMDFPDIGSFPQWRLASDRRGRGTNLRHFNNVRGVTDNEPKVAELRQRQRRRSFPGFPAGRFGDVPGQEIDILVRDPKDTGLQIMSGSEYFLHRAVLVRREAQGHAAFV